jgi:hypothetical protein
VCQCDYQFPCEEHEFNTRCCMEAKPDIPDRCQVPTDEDRAVLKTLIDSARYVPRGHDHD